MLIAKKNLHSCGVELCIKFDLGDCSWSEQIGRATMETS